MDQRERVVTQTFGGGQLAIRDVHHSFVFGDSRTSDVNLVRKALRRFGVAAELDDWSYSRAGERTAISAG